MTPQEKYNLIKQKCVGANPSIMELGRGSEYEDHKGDTMLYVATIANHHYGILKRSHLTSKTIYSCVKSDAIILGRPIRLADIIFTLGKHFIWQYCLEDKSLIFVDDDSDALWSWNLLKDSLQDQSPETIDFLAEILK